MKQSNARCQLSSGNRAGPYSLPGYERQKNISPSLAAKAPVKIQENFLVSAFRFLTPDF